MAATKGKERVATKAKAKVERIATRGKSRILLNMAGKAFAKGRLDRKKWGWLSNLPLVGTAVKAVKAVKEVVEVGAKVLSGDLVGAVEELEDVGQMAFQAIPGSQLVSAGLKTVGIDTEKVISGGFGIYGL